MGVRVFMRACVQVMEYLNKAEKERSDKEKRKMGPRHTAKKTTLTEGAEGTGAAGQLPSQEELQRLKSALAGSQATQSLEATTTAGAGGNNRVVEGRVGKAAAAATAAAAAAAAGTVGKAGKTTKISPTVAATATAAATAEGSLILSPSGSGMSP